MIRKVWPIIILLGYFFAGSLYAVYTPVWQTPDEPAHYNYVRALATGQGLPVMEPGDYDQAYLSRLTSEGFPPELPVDSLEYEDHQPPLYYLLAAPVYRVFNGSVILLRTFSLLLGGIAIVAVMLVVREFYPLRPGLVWFAGGFVATIPQFVAIMAAVNNDALAIMLLWIWLWLALRYIRGRGTGLTLSLAMGALLLTKMTGYGAVPLTALAVLLRCRRERKPGSVAARELALALIPGLVLGSLWWIRNAVVYGWPDVMGLAAHNAVVIGQPRTADAIAQLGLVPFATSVLRTTFRSFWGQFGWMGVVLDARIYRLLVIVSALMAAGGAWWLVEAFRKRTLAPQQRDMLALLAAAALITLVMFIGYNVTFVQHQGRYLFTALPFLALLAAAGLERLLERKLALGVCLVLLAGAAGLAAAGWLAGDIPFWSLAILMGAAAALAVASFVPERQRWMAGAIYLAAMGALDLLCLFGFIIPILG